MSCRCNRWLSSVFVLVGGGLLAWGAYSWYAPPAAPALEAQTDLVIADAVARTKQDVSIQLHNRSRKPMRIVGLTVC